MGISEGAERLYRNHDDSRIVIDLQFLKPFKQRNDTVFTLEPTDSGVKVTWTMAGKHNLMSKAMGLFMSMDKMVGGSFAQGLASLKSISEAKNRA